MRLGSADCHYILCPQTLSMPFFPLDPSLHSPLTSPLSSFFCFLLLILPAFTSNSQTPHLSRGHSLSVPTQCTGKQSKMEQTHKFSEKSLLPGCERPAETDMKSQSSRLRSIAWMMNEQARTHHGFPAVLWD